MKTLILYATKYGAAAEVARRIADRMGGAALHNLKGSPPDLGEFDCVVIGSAVYAGTIRKEAKEFLSRNAEALRGKALGLFLSGMAPGDEKACLEANFSPEMLQSAKAARNLGGIYDPQKVNALERLVMKAASKMTTASEQTGYADAIDDAKIAQFAQEMGA